METLYKILLFLATAFIIYGTFRWNWIIGATVTCIYLAIIIKQNYDID